MTMSRFRAIHVDHVQALEKYSDFDFFLPHSFSSHCPACFFTHISHASSAFFLSKTVKNEADGRLRCRACMWLTTTVGGGGGRGEKIGEFPVVRRAPLETNRHEWVRPPSWYTCFLIAPLPGRRKSDPLHTLQYYRKIYGFRVAATDPSPIKTVSLGTVLPFQKNNLSKKSGKNFFPKKNRP